ncbi:hypothetical protein POM88_030078 [Heracleum sosnowskyi]|uniref:DUF4216 domain-containing protein n=1 Tax=Heracleum sosnowskyi TaxID=360622 RepID=A0AAD8HXX0_9APIA|nr:hypothetical protein POM88_030078 [Heracleum sosnowskyi]
MWTISDFPAMSMLSGWTIAGHLACPHCEDVWHEIESLGLMKITELGSDEHNAKIITSYKCGWKKRRRAHGVGKTRYLDDREYTTANNYVLFNCPEVAPYIDETSNDYFGILEEILIIEYPRRPIKKTTLFKCEWFDPTLNVGTKIHQRYNIVESSTRQGRLASCMQSESSPLVELPQISESRNQDAYQDDFPEHLDVIRTDDIPTHLDDIEGTSVDLDDDEESPEEEVEINSYEEEFSKTDESDFYDSDDA